MYRGIYVDSDNTDQAGYRTKYKSVTNEQENIPNPFGDSQSIPAFCPIHFA